MAPKEVCGWAIHSSTPQIEIQTVLMMVRMGFSHFEYWLPLCILRTWLGALVFLTIHTIQSEIF